MIPMDGGWLGVVTLRKEWLLSVVLYQSGDNICCSIEDISHNQIVIDNDEQSDNH